MPEVIVHQFEALVPVPVWLLWREYFRRERLTPEQRQLEDVAEFGFQTAVISGDPAWQMAHGDQHGKEEAQC